MLVALLTQQKGFSKIAQLFVPAYLCIFKNLYYVKLFFRITCASLLWNCARWKLLKDVKTFKHA